MSNPLPLAPVNLNISNPNTPTGYRTAPKGLPADDTFSSIRPNFTSSKNENENMNLGDSMAFSRIDEKDYGAPQVDEDGDSTMGDDDGYMDHDPENDTSFSMVNADMTNFYNMVNKDGSPAKSPSKNSDNMRTVSLVTPKI